MARKRRTERDRGVDKPPPFDKADFLRKEISDAKLTFVTFFIGLLFTAGSIGIYHAGSPGLAILLGFIGFPALPFIHRLLGYDLDKMFPLKDGKKEEEELKTEKRARSMRMVGQWFTYFFTWLAIFVMALNPPFADVSGPALIKIKATQGTTYHWDPDAGNPPVIHVNVTGTVMLVVTLVDHSGVQNGSVWYRDKVDSSHDVLMDSGAGTGNQREYSTPIIISGTGDSHRFFIASIDVNGHSSHSQDFIIVRT